MLPKNRPRGPLNRKAKKYSPYIKAIPSQKQPPLRPRPRLRDTYPLLLLFWMPPSRRY